MVWPIPAPAKPAKQAWLGNVTGLYSRCGQTLALTSLTLTSVRSYMMSCALHQNQQGLQIKGDFRRGFKTKKWQIEAKPTWHLFWRENQLVQTKKQC